MIYTETTKKAMKLMYEKHKNQLDKAGMPYVFHPMHVAEQMKDENSTTVALLHDIVEDTDMTFEQLRALGFNEEVITALTLMTHEEGVEYFDYIQRIGTNAIARKVKLADLEHNSDLSRLSKIGYEDIARAEKYKKCIEYLSAIEYLQEENNEKQL